jgi:hypothetical protein
MSNDGEFERKFCSAMRGYIPEKYILTYEIGKTTYPKVGRIFVFENLVSATFFLIDNYCAKILEGIGNDIGKPKQLCFYFDNKNFDKFWKLKKNKTKISHDFLKPEIPENTLSCSSFTPTKIM